jgi:hypothetical protein
MIPGGDGSGPRGLGPRSGKSRGFCAGYPVPGYANFRVLGWGRRCGFGRALGPGRRRFRRRIYPKKYLDGTIDDFDPISVPSQEDEKAYLEDLIKILEKELSEAKNRIEELND